MAIINRPFSSISPGYTPKPILPVTIKNPATGQFLNTYGLIDNGADECAFPASFALRTGHCLCAGTAKPMNTGNGRTTAYSHTASIEINGYQMDNVLIDFMEHLSIPLLGVDNFLKNFELRIDYVNQVFSLIEK